MRCRTLLVGFSLAACLPACGEPRSDPAGALDREARQVLVAGMGVAEGDLLLREPFLPTFCGGGSPWPAEPIQGLDDAVAQAFPEQTRGSSHPWTPTIVELLAPTSRHYWLRLEREANDQGRSAPLWSEVIELVAAERCVLVFAVGPRASGGRAVALRRALVRSREQDGAWRVTGVDVRDDAVPADALPSAADTDVHNSSFSSVGGHIAVRPAEIPYALGVWLWLPPPPAGKGRLINVVGPQPYKLVIDGTTYSSAASSGHAFWTLVLASGAMQR